MNTKAMKIGLLLVLLAVAGCSEPPPTLTPLPGDAIILAFGDSLTYGTGASRDKDYPSILAKLSGRKVINEGIPGELTAGGLRRLPGLLQSLRPDLLILIHGGNDLLRKKDTRTTIANLRKMIQLAREADVQVILMAVPEPGLLLKPAPFYRSLAEEFGIPVDLDTLASVLQHQDSKSDTVHPNDKGYRIMAEKLHQLLIDSGAL